MKKFTNLSLPCLVLLTVALLLSACGDGAAKNPVPAQPSRTASGAQPTAQPTSRTAPLSGPVVYIALGASDAVGVGSSQPGSQGYVPLIGGRLPQGSRTINLGVSGIRLREALSQELPIALGTQPDLVTVWLVANDFVGGVSYNDYIRDLNTLLSQLRSGTHARIYLGNLPDLSLLPAFAGQPASTKARIHQGVQRWNAGIASAARRARAMNSGPRARAPGRRGRASSRHGRLQGRPPSLEIVAGA